MFRVVSSVCRLSVLRYTSSRQRWVPMQSSRGLSNLRSAS